MLFRPILISAAAVVALLSSLALYRQMPPPAENDGTWYKGNTHAHTVLSGHGDSSPEYVAGWYLDQGYHFLILSEHNQFIEPDSVELPPGRREDFILIPGEEVTGNKVIHTTAMNVDGLIDWRADHQHKHVIIQHHVDSTHAGGGTPILNHPNFQWALTADDIRPVQRLHHFELYNGHPHVHNHGDSTHASTEEMWDDLLTRGMLIYGVSSDDAHQFQKWATSVSNPGRGWVMVRADELTSESVTRAMERGDFYATSGVILSEVDRGDDIYRVQIDAEKTAEEIASPYLVGHRVPLTSEGFEISFIGDGGEVLKATRGLEASYEPAESGSSYVRAKITYLRPAEDGRGEAFYAWTQPVFTDERAEVASKLGRH